MIPKSGYRFPACAKPLGRFVVWLDASAGEARRAVRSDAARPGFSLRAPPSAWNNSSSGDPSLVALSSGGAMTQIFIDAEPEPIAVDLDHTALIIIDMQRDFLEPGGFGETLGNDVSRLAAAGGTRRAGLAAAGRRGLLVVHTREGHLPDLTDDEKST